MSEKVTPLSLSALPEHLTDPPILSPRSLAACGSEGIDPSELVYRPLEAFAEKGLSPRLVKLRFDFHEAKRKDLLAAACRARETGSGAIDDHMRFLLETGDTSGIIKLEKEHLRQSKSDEKRWLANVLRNELRNFRQMEADLATIQKEEEAADNAEAERCEKQRVANEQRRELEERKQQEFFENMRKEKEIAKQAFLAQQKEAERIAEESAAQRKLMHAEALEEATKRLLAEKARKEAAEKVWAIQQSRLKQIEEHDKERLEVLEKSRLMKIANVRELTEKRNKRIQKSIDNNMQLELYKKEEWLARQEAETERENRLALEKKNRQEQLAKRQIELLLKRKTATQASCLKADYKREAILAHSNQEALRLAEHEKKRQKFIAFKRELDALKEINKAMNVARQRKKEAYHRELVAKTVQTKDTKIETVTAERQRLWDMRKKAADEARAGREKVKLEILHQRVTSSLDGKRIENIIKQVLNGFAQESAKIPEPPKNPKISGEKIPGRQLHSPQFTQALPQEQ